MDENKLKNIFWPSFFLVTGFSFFLFSKVLQWLDGTRQPLFNWIGIVAIVVGLLTGILTLNKKSENN
jgi:hypothetical protein